MAVVKSRYASEFEPIRDKIKTITPDGYDEFVFRHPMSFYRQRVEMMGATGFDRVLDAGQGFGQWAVALAEKNGTVTGVDHGAAMCGVANILIDHYKVKNFTVVQDSLNNAEKLFKPQSFDMIWCWGVIMFTQRSVVMAAFNRLLAPGGKLFLGSVNTPSRWAYKYAKGRWERMNNPHFFEACRNGMRGRDTENGVNAFDFGSAERIGKRYGFDLERIGYDGTIDVSGQKRRLTFESLPFKACENIEIIYRKTAEHPLTAGAS